MSDTLSKQATVLDFEIPSFYNTYGLDSYGGLKIAVYKSKLGQTYFYTPLILVDWLDFKDSLESFEGDKNSNENVELSVIIQHSDNIVESEIVNKIRISEKLPDTSSIALNLLPFKFYKIYAKIGSNKVLLNEDDFNSLSPEDNFTTQLNLMHERAYLIKGTFKELEYFYNNRRINLIWANLYSDGSPYSTTTISAFSTFLSNTENTKKLFGDESIDNKTKVESSSNGYGAKLSLGPLNLGGGGTSTTTTSSQSKQRLFNRTFFSDFFESNKSSLNIIVDGDTTKYSQLIDKFIGQLFENKKQFQVKIEKIENDCFQLTGDIIGQVKLNLGQSKALIKSKPIIDVQDNTKIEIAIKGVPIKAEKDFKVKTEDDVEWTLEGTDYIPTNVNLSLFSEINLKDEFSSIAILFSREAKKNTITPFLYPAVWLSRNNDYISVDTSDKDNPIGSILAFAGTKANIPAGWALCDGSLFDTTDYSQLFGIIGYNWGRGGDNSQFRIPDLQGVFLRGVDYNKTRDTDADSRNANGEGISCEVGSFQSHALQNHRHSGIYPNGGASFEHHQHNARTPAESWTSNSGYVTDANIANETRPMNNYVNYIIRLK